MSKNIKQIYDRWLGIPTEAKIVVLVAVVFVLYRALLATQSGFGFHQGWNEGHYSLIGRGFLRHPLVPRYGDLYVYNVPPLFPYLVAGSFALLGPSSFAARLPSILATGLAIPAVYLLGRTLFDRRRVALLGAIIFAALPYVQLYGGRAQTDVLMICAMTGSLACIVRGYDREHWKRWMYAGGGLYVVGVTVKQPALLLAAVVVGWLVLDGRWGRETIHRTVHLVGSTLLWLVPVFLWYLYNYTAAPEAFLSDWYHELFNRTAAFANVKLLVIVALGLGITPPVLFLVGTEFAAWVRTLPERFRNGNITSGIEVTPLGLWLLVFGAFVFYRTPQGHQYYAVVLLPAIALIAARGFVRLTTTIDRVVGQTAVDPGVILAVLVGVALFGGTVVILDLSGEFSVSEGGGERIAPDTAKYLSSKIPEDAVVFVPNEYQPPISWYVRQSPGLDSTRGYRLSNLTADTLRSHAGNTTAPVYLLYPDPPWSPRPDVPLDRIFSSDAYRLSTTGFIPHMVRPGGKFVHYFGERRLIVYKVCPDAEC